MADDTTKKNDNIGNGSADGQNNGSTANNTDNQNNGSNINTPTDQKNEPEVNIPTDQKNEPEVKAPAKAKKQKNRARYKAKLKAEQDEKINELAAELKRREEEHKQKSVGPKKEEPKPEDATPEETKKEDTTVTDKPEEITDEANKTEEKNNTAIPDPENNVTKKEEANGPETKAPPAGPQEEKKAANEPKPDNTNAIAVYKKAVDGYNKAHGTQIDADAFASDLVEAWQKISSGSEIVKDNGLRMLRYSFEGLLKQTFEAEARESYINCKEASFANVAKETNDLMRTAMFAYTDVYTGRDNDKIYKSTVFGGMNSEQIANVAASRTAWQGDQKSDEAWEKQSAEARKIASDWKNTADPYATMIENLKELNDIKSFYELDDDRQRDIINKLAAAECMLMSDSSMMVDDPDNPYAKVPDWSNRNWKSLAYTREKIGVSKFTSMREIIQGAYAATKPVSSNRDIIQKETSALLFNEKGEPRAEIDSINVKTEELARESVHMAESRAAADMNDRMNAEKTEERVPIYIPEADDKVINKDVPKSMPLHKEKANELKAEAVVN